MANFFSKVLGGVTDFLGDVGGFLTGSDTVKKQQQAAINQSAAQAADLFKRFQEQRTIRDEEFEKAFAAITNTQNPFLSSIGALEEDFRAAPQRVLGSTLQAANIQARRAGGGRGQAYSTAAAALAQRGGVEAGFGLGAAQQTALQNIASLRQFQAQLALPERTALIRQNQDIVGALQQNALGAQAQFSNTALQTFGNIGQQRVAGDFGLNFSGALGGEFAKTIGAASGLSSG